MYLHQLTFNFSNFQMKEWNDDELEKEALEPATLQQEEEGKGVSKSGRQLVMEVKRNLFDDSHFHGNISNAETDGGGGWKDGKQGHSPHKHGRT